MDNMCNGDLIAELIAEGQEWFDSSEPEFNTGSPECEAYLRNLEDYPHFFVLACIMDRGVPAERAWRIPFQVCADIRIDGPEFKKLLVPGAND
ncbi:MAG: hypothetical protein KC777_30145, partial [Cyanobacteria bacterium HKST-UBA02]|nr:hypothetical protein [Cyanobacteria bacterium HKST-UBA02]